MKKLFATLGVLALLVVGITTVWAAGGYQATAYNTCTFSTGYPPTCERFSIAGGGALYLYQDGSGQSIVPGDTKWTYFPARTWDTSHAVQNGSRWTVTVPEFSFTNASTGTLETVHEGFYEVDVFRGHYYTVTNPPGTLSVTVQ